MLIPSATLPVQRIASSAPATATLVASRIPQARYAGQPESTCQKFQLYTSESSTGSAHR